MILIKPVFQKGLKCDCEGTYTFIGLLWQGLHISEKYSCNKCASVMIKSLPVNQSGIEQYTYFPHRDLICDNNGNLVNENWFTSKLKSVSNPLSDPVEMKTELFKKCDEVLILNTLDYVYGHSLLFLLNLQRVIRNKRNTGVIVIIQPMFRWMIPEQGVDEIWTVNLSFNKFNNYYPDLSLKINSELARFKKVWLSRGHLIPTNLNVEIEHFTRIRPFDFMNKPAKSRITFIWREDPDRLWIRNVYLLKGIKKLGLSVILKPFQYFRVFLFLRLLKHRFGNEYLFSIAGFGKSFKFPSFIDDQRTDSFDDIAEKQLCRIYSESILVMGIHGSAMLLPSAHAGMAISLMPSKRWGNFAEDILFTENDVRLAAFQRRIVPLNIWILDIRDIAIDMITGRDEFIRKFIHSDEI